MAAGGGRGVRTIAGAMLAAALAVTGCGDDAAADEPAPAGDGAPAMPGTDAGGTRDAAQLDAALDGGGAPELDAASDAAQGAPDAGDDAAAPSAPATLADTGLYAPGSTSELAPGVVPFTPRYALWSDGADKQRWLLLPEGAQIDTSDMDSWQLPVGTKLWKEFAKDGKRLETRLLHKTERGWYAIAFVWNDDESEAVAAPDGAENVRGTGHDVPRRIDCRTCHEGRPDFALGLSAIQLAHDGAGVTLAALAAEGRLSDPPAADLALPDTTEWNALGYLHANCGNCHNPTSITWDKLDLDLWLRTGELSSPAATQSYLSTVSVPLTEAMSGGVRIAPGDAAGSGLVQRMMRRGDEFAMPPIASEQVDEAGVQLLSAFIGAL